MNLLLTKIVPLVNFKIFRVLFSSFNQSILCADVPTYQAEHLVIRKIKVMSAFFSTVIFLGLDDGKFTSAPVTLMENVPLTLLVNEKTLISTEILTLNGVKVFSLETC
jgi:hypothetical protein